MNTWFRGQHRGVELIISRKTHLDIHGLWWLIRGWSRLRNSVRSIFLLNKPEKLLLLRNVRLFKWLVSWSPIILFVCYYYRMMLSSSLVNTWKWSKVVFASLLLYWMSTFPIVALTLVQPWTTQAMLPATPTSPWIQVMYHTEARGNWMSVSSPNTSQKLRKKTWN